MPDSSTIVEVLLFFGSAFVAVAIPAATAVIAKAWRSPQRTLVAFLFWSLAFAYLLYELDSAFAISVSWMACFILVVLTAALATPLFLRHRSKLIPLGCGLFAASIITLHFVSLSAVKPFRRFFTSAHPGMTRSEVLDQLHRNFPEGGRFPQPVTNYDGPDRLVFVLDPSKWYYNAEIVQLRLRDGKTVAKEYHGD
jgi:hypothetical protein